MSISRLRGNSQCLVERILSAAEYLGAVDATWREGWNWLQSFERYQSGEANWINAMALVDPKFYVGQRDNVQGARAFQREILNSGIGCGAERIWGYPCDLDFDNELAGDHIWPWSLGGPNVASNKLHLCKTHNRLKGMDVHLFPWEKGRPAWLDTQLAKVASIVTA